MKLAIMQPYFLPYIGYYQLINAVDEFIIYDNIEYTKKGWINRNRFLSNGIPRYFTITLQNDSDYLHIRERKISPDFENNRVRILNKLKNEYSRAPYFDEIIETVESVFHNEETNLFKYLFQSITKVMNFLRIKTKLIPSSEIKIDHALKNIDKVISICRACKANEYINLPGGIQLYDKNKFIDFGILLKFIQPKEVKYKQFGSDFIDKLSIIDVLMFNGREKTIELLNYYDLK